MRMMRDCGDELRRMQEAKDINSNQANFWEINQDAQSFGVSLSFPHKRITPPFSHHTAEMLSLNGILTLC